MTTSWGSSGVPIQKTPEKYDNFAKLDPTPHTLFFAIFSIFGLTFLTFLTPERRPPIHIVVPLIYPFFTTHKLRNLGGGVSLFGPPPVFFGPPFCVATETGLEALR